MQRERDGEKWMRGDKERLYHYEDKELPLIVLT